MGTRREEEEEEEGPSLARGHIPGRAGPAGAVPPGCSAENPGTVLLLKPPIQGTDGQHKREEAEGRGSTEGSVCGRTDAGAAVDPPRCPFLRRMRSGVPPESPTLLSL